MNDIHNTVIQHNTRKQKKYFKEIPAKKKLYFNMIKVNKNQY